MMKEKTASEILDEVIKERKKIKQEAEAILKDMEKKNA